MAELFLTFKTNINLDDIRSDKEAGGFSRAKVYGKFRKEAVRHNVPIHVVLVNFLRENEGALTRRQIGSLFLNIDQNGGPVIAMGLILLTKDYLFTEVETIGPWIIEEFFGMHADTPLYLGIWNDVEIITGMNLGTINKTSTKWIDDMISKEA